MYPENPEGTQVIIGSMNMGYISDTARNRTHNLFRPKREPIPLGHSDGLIDWFCLLCLCHSHFAQSVCSPIYSVILLIMNYFLNDQHAVAWCSWYLFLVNFHVCKLLAQGWATYSPRAACGPLERFDAACGIFWILCKIAPKTRFLSFHCAIFIWHWQSLYNWYFDIQMELLYHRLENGPILKEKFKDMESANCYASLKHEFACHKDDYFILIDKHLLINFLLHEHQWLIDRRPTLLYTHYTANWCKFAFHTTDLNKYTFYSR